VIAALLITTICLIAYVTALPGPADDQTQSVDRNGSVETGVSVERVDSAHEVILTTHKVWLHDSIYASIVHRDTIPGLDSLTTDAENNDGDTKTVKVKRDYQIFIT